MPEYRVKRPCGWGEKSWTAGQTIAEGELPADVIKVLLARDAVEAVRGPARSEAAGALEGPAPEGAPERFDELADHGAESSPKGRKKG